MSHGSHNPISRFPSSVPAQNLTDEGLLHKARRDADNRPVMGGIPLIAKLGQGGMGAVYYGIHPRLNMEVAVKVLPFHLADQSPDMIRRFFGEAQIAARVQSDHIVRVIDVNEESGVYYLVMEYVRGMSAAGVLKALQKGEYVADVAGVKTSAVAGGTPALPVATALAVITGATRGLAAAHANDVIHRDIKPDNIMIPRGMRRDPLVEPPLEPQRAKLADLGLAKQDDGTSMGTMSQMAMGTPGYMAPEQVRDAKRATKRSDVFSMGATLYALLAGRMPFAGSGVGDVLIKTVSAPHDPLVAIRPDVPAPVRDLIDRCLEKEPANRPADGADLLDRLLALQSAGGMAGMGPTGGATPVPRAPVAFESGASRGHAAAGTPLPGAGGPGSGPGSGLGARGAATASSAGEAARPAAQSGNRGLILILALMAVFLMVVLVGGAATYWFGVVVPEQQEYLRMVEVGHKRYLEAKNEHADGKLSDEEYLTRLQGAMAFVHDALNKDHTGIEAQKLQDEINKEQAYIQGKAADGKSKTEAQFHDFYNRAILKEAGAKAAEDEKTAAGLWREAADLYGQASALRPENTEVAGDLARAKQKLLEYAGRTDANLEKVVAEAAGLEKKADEETDLAVSRKLWTEAGEAWEKVRQVAPQHPCIAAGQVRVKDALEDIKRREEGEITMLVLAAQVAADRGAVAKDPERSLEDWNAAVNGFERALALRPKDNAIKTKRDGAVKRKTQLEAFFGFLKEGEEQGRKFHRAHTVPELKAAAAGCLKAFESAAANFPDELTRQKVEIVKQFVVQADDCQRGWVLYDKSDLSGARQIFEQVTAVNGNLAFAWYHLARASMYVAPGEEQVTEELRDKMSAMFERATAIDPAYAEAWYWWGDMLESAPPQIEGEEGGEGEDGEIALYHANLKYVRAVEAEPRYVRAWMAWASALRRLSNYGLAVRKLQQVLALEPKNTEAWEQTAACYLELPCYELAAAAYEQATKLEPARGDLWKAWAQSLADTGNWEAAEPKIRKAVALLPDDTGCVELAADIAQRVAERQDWEKLCGRWKALADAGVLSTSDFCLWIGKLKELGRLKEAASRCQAGVAANPDSAERLNCWADVLASQGDYEGAVEKSERANELTAHDAALKKKLSTYKLNVESERKTRKQFADYMKALEANPRDVATLESWASDLYYMNRDEEALIKIKRANELEPENNSCWDLRWRIEDDILFRARNNK